MHQGREGKDPVSGVMARRQQPAPDLRYDKELTAFTVPTSSRVHDVKHERLEVWAKSSLRAFLKCFEVIYLQSIEDSKRCTQGTALNVDFAGH
jgi:hypothetical protein